MYADTVTFIRVVFYPDDTEDSFVLDFHIINTVTTFW